VTQVACFAAGTRIATAQGEVAVEDLREGDLVRTVLRGGVAAIAWIGRRTVDCRSHPKPATVWPVRVRAGAFGVNVPQRDLYLSPDHAVYVNEVLVPVRHLINGTSIAQVATDSVTYYHVELPTHDVVLAEGLAAESYLETGERANFSNGGGVVRQFPDFAARAWEALGCAKLIVTGPELEASRGRVIVSMPASHPGPAAERRAS
jgi:collagen type I alpha